MNGDEAGSNCETEGYSFVLGTGLVQVLGQSPGSGVGVVRLDGCSTPRGVSVAVDEEFTVAADDTDHDGIVDETAQNGTVDLSQEHGTRWDLDY